MPEVTITLESHDEELAVFGSRDQFLRQVRDAFGVKVVARHGEVRVEGETRPGRAGPPGLRGAEGLATGDAGPTSAGDVAELIESRGPRPSPTSRTAGRDPRGEQGRPGPDRRPGPLPGLPPRQRAGLLHRPGRDGQDLPGRGMAVAELRKGKIKKIVLVRPAVEAGEHLGFLPGDLEAKINPYLRPLLDALHDLMDYDQIRRYMGNDLIEIAPLAYMRGRTLNDAVIILDEGQNATVPQMKMFLTRMGQNARIVVTGDTSQVDLPPATVSGLADAVERLRDVAGDRDRRRSTGRTSSGTRWSRRSSTPMRRPSRPGGPSRSRPRGRPRAARPEPAHPPRSEAGAPAAAARRGRTAAGAAPTSARRTPARDGPRAR